MFVHVARSSIRVDEPGASDPYGARLLGELRPVLLSPAFGLAVYLVTILYFSDTEALISRSLDKEKRIKRRESIGTIFQLSSRSCLGFVRIVIHSDAYR
jgi:hypothetical protein